MSPLMHSAVATRRLLAKHPWIYWVAVGIVAVSVAASVLDRADAVDAERAAWGDTVTVWIADREHAPGEPLSARSSEVPAAIAPPGRIDDPRDLSMRQRIGVGEIVTDVDVVAPAGPQALIPPGWLGVPIVESPPSGAAIGDRVEVVSDGVVVTDDAIIVGHHDDVTIVAMPAAVAPAAPAAAEARSLTLLLTP